VKVGDTMHFGWRALIGARARTALIFLAMSIGVASVMLLTGLGEAARRYVVAEFAALGTDVIAVMPGRSETVGGAPPMVGGTARDLTIDDAMALLRHREIIRVSPITIGMAPASRAGRERDVTVLGATTAYAEVFRLEMASGQFLPASDPDLPNASCVVGRTLEREMFDGSAIGEALRVGESRCRVVGVLASEGSFIQGELDTIVILPVANAMALFDTPTLFRIAVQASHRDQLDSVRQLVIDTLRERHDGYEDVTVITQDAMLTTFDRILKTLTYGVAGIGSISLVVAGILIMNVMLVAVSQRTSEIGLLKAIGAAPRQIERLFLAEAGLLSLSGGAIGLGIGAACNWALGLVYPKLDFTAPYWAIPAALGIALFMGLLFGAMPARRAARLDPVKALARR